jgi:hypothetical protein
MTTNGRSANHNDLRGCMEWRSRNRKIREVGIDVLQWVDGVHSASRWGRAGHLEEFDDEQGRTPAYDFDDTPAGGEDGLGASDLPPLTPLTRKPSARSKGRHSLGEETTLDEL